MHNQLLYIVYWIITCLVLYLANLFYPQSVVLGNYKLEPFEAAIYGGFWITFISWMIVDILTSRGFKQNSLFLFIAIYFVANTAAIWMTARLARLAGFGIESYQWALILSLILVVFQRIAWIFFGDKDNKKTKKKK